MKCPSPPLHCKSLRENDQPFCAQHSGMERRICLLNEDEMNVRCLLNEGIDSIDNQIEMILCWEYWRKDLEKR